MIKLRRRLAAARPRPTPQGDVFNACCYTLSSIKACNDACLTIWKQYQASHKQSKVELTMLQCQPYLCGVGNFVQMELRVSGGDRLHRQSFG